MKNSKYLNFTQFTNTTDIDDKDIIKVNTIIDQWLKWHTSDLIHLNFNVSHTRVQSLIYILYTHFTLYFADRFSTFIKLVMKLLVQHNLFNKRCKMRHEDFKEEEEVTYKNMIILSLRFTSEKAKTNV